jgi:hypothetical protein
LCLLAAFAVLPALLALLYPAQPPAHACEDASR